MKRLFFFSVLDFTNWESNGLCKKVVNQVNAFRDSGFLVEFSYLLGGEIWVDTGTEKRKIGKTKGLIITNSICKYLTSYVRSGGFDVMYVRYCFSGSGFIKMLKTLHGNLKSIIVEIPTYPYDKEFVDNLKKRIFLAQDQLYRRKMKKYVDRIVTFYNDDEIFGIPTIKAVNGIDFTQIKLRKIKKNDSVIHLIAVSSMSKWHGYDRLIGGMGEYYKNGGKRDVVFHLVGEGDGCDFYKKLAKNYSLENNVILHGMKFGDELDEIYDSCNMAVETLGMHRKNLHLSSSLKSREYAAKGLPIMTSCEIDVFPSAECSFIYKVSEDDEYIKIEQLIDFYDDLYRNNDETTLANKIRNYAVSVCSMSVSQEKVINYFNEVIVGSIPQSECLL